MRPSTREAAIAAIIAVTAIVAARTAGAASWLRSYEQGSTTNIAAIAPLASGGCVLASDGYFGIGLLDTSLVFLDDHGRATLHEIRGTISDELTVDADVSLDGKILLTASGGILKQHLADGRLDWARQLTLLDDREEFRLLSVSSSSAIATGGWFVLGSGLTQPFGCDPSIDGCLNWDACLMKVSGTGIAWSLSYDLGGYESGIAIESRPTGGAIACLWPNLVVSIGSDGLPEWTTRLFIAAPGCTENPPSIKAVFPTRDGGVLACGGGDSCAVERAWIVRLASDGSVLWERHDEWPLPTIFNGQWGWVNVIELDDTSIAVQGHGRVAMLDEDGNELWTRRFPVVDPNPAYRGDMAVVGSDVVAAWQPSGNVVRIGRDGSVGGTPCAPVEVEALPGGLVTPDPGTPVALGSRAVLIRSSLVAVDRLEMCADPRCIELCAGGELDCADGADDDADGATDCDDDDCAGSLECPDADGDGVIDSQDAAPNDPGVHAVPDEVSLRVARDGASSGILLEWQDQKITAGSGTTQDVVRGSISDFRSGECLARDVNASDFIDGPGSPTSAWYLVTARNGAGSSALGGPPEIANTCN